MRTLILASTSPRRHELLPRLGLPFQVRTAEVDERPLPGETPQQTVQRLSRLKAAAVGRGLDTSHKLTGSGEDYLVIAADTLVVLDGQVLGKPHDAEEAVEILSRLRGRAHRVISGLTVLEAPAGRMITQTVSTIVWMRDYSEAEIAAYVATGDPLDKAGAYAVQRSSATALRSSAKVPPVLASGPGRTGGATAQHGDFRPVERTEGCPLNVMGLPLCRLDEMLRQLGALAHPTPAQRCDPPHHCELAPDFIP